MRGLIDVNESDGTVKVGGIIKSGDKFNDQFSGKKEITKGVKEIKLDFSNVNLELKNGDSSEVNFAIALKENIGSYVRRKITDEQVYEDSWINNDFDNKIRR